MMSKKNIFISIIAIVVILFLAIYILPWIIVIAALVYVFFKVKAYIFGRKEKDISAEDSKVYVGDKNASEKMKTREEVIDVDYKPID